MIHVISHNKKFAVVKTNAKRATRLFKYREQAFHFAKRIDSVCVHNDDGSVLFIDKDKY